MPNARLALPALALSLALAGCGPAATSASSGTAGSASTSAGSATATSSAGCPTENTTAFAKTRFVADVGLAAGSFHRYIYKPWRAGTFAKGAHGRTLALVKAAGTAVADAKLLKDAADNAKANPTLCTSIYGPLSKASAALDDLKGKLESGDLTSISGIEGSIQSVLTGSRTSGLPVTETTS